MEEARQFLEPDIKNQLNLILRCPLFLHSKVLSLFLDYIVKETLIGKGNEIKEYTIGVNVLSRSSNFNPQFDGIVRTHAGRLRRALKEYYAEFGQNDFIRIDIPKGSYIPLFLPQKKMAELEKKEQSIQSKKRPVVAVLPFRNISNDTSREFFADGLGEQLSTELTRFQDLCVISYFSSRIVGLKATDFKEVANLLGAKYIVTGSIQSDTEHLRIWVQLVFAETGEQLWTKSFERVNTAPGLYEIQNEIVRSIQTAIGGYFGAIFRNAMNPRLDNMANDIEVYDAIFWYYHYQKLFTEEAFKKAISVLENAVRTDPNYALAWAMLGELYLDERALEFNTVKKPMEEGLKCALHAIEIDPNCQHAYMALAWIYLFFQERDKSIKAALQCIAINPNASDKVGAMGFGLICAGDFERGFTFLQESVTCNPYCPWWFHLGFSFYYTYKKDYPAALHSAEAINRPDIVWDLIMMTCLLAELGRSAEAAKHLDRLVQLIPNPESHANDVIETFLLSDELKAGIRQGLKKAGLAVIENVSTNK